MIIGVAWAPIRLALFAFGSVSAWLLTKLITLDVTFPVNLCSVQERPTLGSLRRRLIWAVYWIFFRICGFGLGIYTAKVVDAQKRDPNARIAVYGPHSTIMDGSILLAMSDLGSDRTPTGFSAEAERHRPILGIFGLCLEFIYVDYDDPNSKRAAINGSKFRSTSPDWATMFQVFAGEGTTHSGRELLQIKKGACVPGAPIQPYILTFPEWIDAIVGNVGRKRNAERGSGWAGWCEDSNLLQLIWYQLTTPWQPMTVTVLPAVYPSAAEKADPSLFANNIQKLMSEASGLPISLLNNTDCNLAGYIYRKYPHLNWDDFRGESHPLEDEFGAKMVTRVFAKACLDEFLHHSEGKSVIPSDRNPFGAVESLQFKDFLRQKCVEKAAN